MRDFLREAMLNRLVYNTPLEFRRPCNIVTATIDCGPSVFSPHPKPKPRSKQWRRPKRWRARDILEHRGVQGVGFRGIMETEGIALRDESWHIDHDAVLLDLARSGPVYTHVFAPCLSEDLS